MVIHFSLRGDKIHLLALNDIISTFIRVTMSGLRHVDSNEDMLSAT